MLGDRRLAQSERLHQLRYVRVSRRETSKDCASCGICKRAEGQAKRVSLLLNLHMAILPYSYIQVKPLGKHNQTSNPYTGIAAPVSCPPDSEARNAASAATLSGCTHFAGSALGLAFRLASVFIVAGRITFAVMPRSLFSRAAVCTSEVKAAFD